MKRQKEDIQIKYARNGRIFINRKIVFQSTD